MTGLSFAYGSNGLGDHRLADACAFLADEGYDGIALTLDHQHLDPFGPDLDRRVDEVRRLLDDDEGLDEALMALTFKTHPAGVKR